MDWQKQFIERLRQNADLSKTNWFQVGGAAEWLFKPQDTQDLADFMRVLPSEIPVTILGVGSNVIVRDGGIEGVVIKLGRGFTEVRLDDDFIIAGGGMLDVNVALYACDHGRSGLEFLSGIPGTMGGAVKMNAGAYGSDMSQVLEECEIVLRSGEIIYWKAADCQFSYRHSAVPEGAVVTRTVLRTQADNAVEIARRMQQIQQSREDTQPIRSRTGGSTFKNPEGHKAWEMIDAAGLRGFALGGAMVSDKHCNFLINTGSATAADLESLGNHVIAVVKEKTGVTLEWEIKRVGRK